MTTETVQAVLRDMRRIAAIQPQEFADRIERALAGSEAMAWRYRYYDSSGWTYQQERPNDPPHDNRHGKVIEPLYAHPAIGNKPAVDLSKYRGALVDAAKYSRTDYFHSDLLDLIALIDSAQDGKGE